MSVHNKNWELGLKSALGNIKALWMRLRETSVRGTRDDVSNAHDDDNGLKSTVWVIRLVGAFLAVFLIWAYFAELDEVAHGNGKVIPTSREQVIQSLEGGIVAKLYVAEGDVVEANQVLAQLDPTINESNVEETAAKYRASLAAASRLKAETEQRELRFPPELSGFPELVASETKLYQERRTSLSQSVAGLRQQLALLSREIKITAPLAAVGAASSMDVLKLKRQRSELEMQLSELTAKFLVDAREQLAKAEAEVAMLSSAMRGRRDTLTRTKIRSPVRGIIKDIEVSTVGGVIPPNGRLMHIVPIDDKLLIEARISPRDIAYIHHGQASKVKITAYDYSIYGTLGGKVVTISPDTIQDKVKPDNYYYHVFIRTDVDYLKNKKGVKMSITPGMVATVDIKTGRKSVLDYIIKPFNKVNEALRER